MTKRNSEQHEPQVFEQHLDERGRIRLDRKFTAVEAAEQDAENRRCYVENRAKRFFGPPAPEEAGQ